MMLLKKSINEKQLHQIWLKQELISELKVSTGEDISIIYPGEYNKDEGGPDFKNARIKIGTLNFIGDIEIDGDYSDWKNHGHNTNRNYNKVILHISYTNRQNQNYVYTCDGRKVHSVPLLDKIPLDNLIFNIPLGGKKKADSSFSLKCTEGIDKLREEFRHKYILELGIKRFKNKCERIYSRLKELKFISDLELKEPIVRFELTKEFNNKEFLHKDFKDKLSWNQLLYELVFEALGYSKNKTIMMKLAQNVTIEFLSQFKTSHNYIPILESIYFKIAGLLPEIDNKDESLSSYIASLDRHWKNLSPQYDGKTFDETQWHFLGQRPQNFPTIRIAGGARIVKAIICDDLIAVILKKFSETESQKILINSVRSHFIIKAEDYWKQHYVFEKITDNDLNYFIGLGRADEIFINVILPYLFVYFEIFGNEELSKKVLNVYNEYVQSSDNVIIKRVAEGLKLSGLNKKTIFSQGMIEVYKNYCSRDKCIECEIGKNIFT